MRVFCLERDNVTQLCDPDSDGDVYTSSFELFPFHEGTTYSLYLGVYNGSGPYAGQFTAVRSLLDITAKQAHWQCWLKGAREAQRLAHEFNKELAYPAVFFNVPVLTCMESVSDFNGLFRCFKPHDKRLKLGEYVTLEPYLEGDFQQFDQSTVNHHYSGGMYAQPGEPDIIEHVSTAPARLYATMPKDFQSTCGIAHAFSHFTWHLTKNLVICSLQGVVNGLTYTLTNPVIHSVGATFGATDGSIKAIAEFFRIHRCNNICRGWDKYIPERNAMPQVNFLQDLTKDPHQNIQQLWSTSCLHNNGFQYFNKREIIPSAPENFDECPAHTSV